MCKRTVCSGVGNYQTIREEREPKPEDGHRCKGEQVDERDGEQTNYCVRLARADSFASNYIRSIECWFVSCGQSITVHLQEGVPALELDAEAGLEFELMLLLKCWSAYRRLACRRMPTEISTLSMSVQKVGSAMLRNEMLK